MDAYAGRWQRDRLAPIRDVLPREWRARYDALVAAYGAPHDDEGLPPDPGTLGPTSPKSVEELEAMGVEELAAYLESWEPPGGPFAPSPEGLARALAWVVRADPERYVTEAGRFSGLEPTSVRGFVEGFREALERGSPFPCGPVMEFCRAVVERPRGTDDRGEGYLERDASLGPARLQIARLLADALAAPGPSRIPLALRDEVWAVLRPLTEDLEPTPVHERAVRRPRLHPGRANHHRRAPGGRRGRRRLRKVDLVGAHCRGRRYRWTVAGVGQLARSSRRPCRAPGPRRRPGTHDTGGLRGLLTWLAILDPGWVRTNLPGLFPEDPALSNLRDAAWEAYVVWNEPTGATAELLHEEYQRAIQRLTKSAYQNRLA